MHQAPSSYLYPALLGPLGGGDRADGARQAAQHINKAHHHVSSSASPRELCWGLQQQLEPQNHSYVSSCAVDSAQHNSCPMDWSDTAPMPDQAPKRRDVAARAHLAHNKRHAACAAGAVPAAVEDPLGSAAAAAAAAANPWAWLSDVATASGPACGPAHTGAEAQGDKCSSMLHYHNASRRLFTTDSGTQQDPKSSMQSRLQQQAQQLQAELALATQQLQLQMHIAAAPALPLAG